MKPIKQTLMSGAIMLALSLAFSTVIATKGSGSPTSIGKADTSYPAGYQTCGTITIGGDATTYAGGVTESPFTYPVAP